MKDQPFNYTRLFNAPVQASANAQGQDPVMKMYKNKVIVELIGHPFPPLYYSNMEPNKKMIHNVLLSEARRELKLQKEAEKRDAALNTVKNLEDEVD